VDVNVGVNTESDVVANTGMGIGVCISENLGSNVGSFGDGHVDVGINIGAVVTVADVFNADADILTAGVDVLAAGVDVFAADADVLAAGADVITADADVITADADVITADADVVTADADVVTAGAEVCADFASHVLFVHALTFGNGASTYLTGEGGTFSDDALSAVLW